MKKKVEPIYPLGAKVRIIAEISRWPDGYRQYRDGSPAYGVHKVKWKRSELSEPKIGIVTGQRTVSNGERYSEDEFGWAYEAKERFTALYVTTDVRKNHYVCLPEDVSEVPES